MNFWKKLKKPFFAFAPMDDVTDVVFREVVSKAGRPDVFFTEFTNVEGLNSKGREVLMERLQFTQNQRPVVAQIWGLEPENYFKAARLIKSLGFDGIDINMGCPQKKVIKKGACSGLIGNYDLAGAIIEATKKGAGGLPVSVKTRIGFKSIQTEEWMGFLLGQNLAALTVHGRLAKDMSKYSANWDEIGKAVNIRNEMGVETLIVGNGDVKNREDGLIKQKEFKVDGIMIGRGIFQDIHAFSTHPKNLGPKESLQLLFDHMYLFDSTWKGTKNFAIMKKFFKIYVSGFENSSDLREKLMSAKNSQDVEQIVSGMGILQ